MEGLKQHIADYEDDATWLCRLPTKPVKPEEVMMSLPEEMERHILDYSGHNQAYERQYLNWIFEALSVRTNRAWNFWSNAKHYFMWYNLPEYLKWNGEARDLLKAMLKKQIDELTAIYDEI